MRHLFIINSHSYRTSDKLKQVFKDIEDCFSNGQREEYEIYISRYPRDAVSVIHHYINKMSDRRVRVYAVGDDDILFDCLNGVAGFPNVELTAIPYGISNDFLRAFGENALERFLDIKGLLTAPSHNLDMIDCGSNYAINEVAFGVEAQAILNAKSILSNPRMKWLHNSPALLYRISALNAIRNKEIRYQRYHVILDDEELPRCYCNISVSNTACIGGSMISSPYARPDDGLFDVILAKSCGMLAAVKLLSDFTKGHYEKNKAFLRRQARKMEITSDVPIRIHLDGECFFTDKIKLEIVPGGMKFIVPKDLGIADYSYRAYKAAKRKKEVGSK